MAFLNSCQPGLRILQLTAILLMLVVEIHSQPLQRLSIEDAYKLARKNYPMIREKELISKTLDYTVSNAAKGYLPMLSISGQGTYQSAVTNFPFKIPIAGLTIPTISKDQYKAVAELDQVIYDGGVIRNQKQTARASAMIQQQNLEVELYALYDRVNQIFFGALLMDEQIKQNDLLKADIKNGIDKTTALLNNGMAYRSSVDELKAQLMQADQSRIELLSSKKAYLDMLGVFINQPLDTGTMLVKPDAPAIADAVTRPELLSYDYQKKTYDLQEALLKTELRPKLSFFVQGGYGRPGLNMLSNDFAWYYLGGLKLSFNLGSLYTQKNQRQILNIDRKMLDIQKETFLFNTQISRKQEDAEIMKFVALMDKDNAIIDLRESVKKAASAQLENGVLSAHDYITQVNAEDQARQNLILHQMQWLQARYNYQQIMGNITIQ